MDREKAYRDHLMRKTRSLHAGLDAVGYGSCRPRVLQAPLKAGFRSRAKFKVFRDRETSRVFGTDPAAGEVTVEDMLWILPPWAREMVMRVRDALITKGGSPPVDGFEIKLAHGRQEAHLTLSVKRGERSSCEALAGSLLSRHREIRGVAVPSLRESYGDEWMCHLIEGREFQAHYSAFFQSHPCLTSRLLHEVEKVSMGSEKCGIVDLYCGAGLLSLFLGLPDTPILGVDHHRRAVESAVRNADRMGFGQARYVCARVEDHVPSLDIPPDHLVLLDPPRSGCPDTTIRAVAGKGPRRICLISCSPQTHLRDLGVWWSAGYVLRRMAALDMFPFTGFLETVSLLESRD